MRGTKRNASVDPLFQIFERQLMTRSYEDSPTFTKELAKSYLAYLDSTPAHVPFDWRENLLEDLATEAHELLVKKMYGCVRVSDYLDIGRVMKINHEKVEALEFDPKTVESNLTKEEQFDPTAVEGNLTKEER